MQRRCQIEILIRGFIEKIEKCLCKPETIRCQVEILIIGFIEKIEKCLWEPETIRFRYPK